MPAEVHLPRQDHGRVCGRLGAVAGAGVVPGRAVRTAALQVAEKAVAREVRTVAGVPEMHQRHSATRRPWAPVASRERDCGMPGREEPSWPVRPLGPRRSRWPRCRPRAGWARHRGGTGSVDGVAGARIDDVRTARCVARRGHRPDRQLDRGRDAGALGGVLDADPPRAHSPASFPVPARMSPPALMQNEIPRPVRGDARRPRPPIPSPAGGVEDPAAVHAVGQVRSEQPPVRSAASAHRRAPPPARGGPRPRTAHRAGPA